MKSKPNIFFFLILICTCALFTMTSSAQYTYDWAKKVGGANTDWAYDVAVDGDGKVITGGVFNNQVDFDPSSESEVLLQSVGSDNAFISKLDADGNYVWVKQLPGKSAARAVGTDASNNIYVGGSFQNSFDFDAGVGESTLTSNGLNDAFLAKYSPDGELLWVKSFGGQHHDGIVRLAVNENGDVAVCGYFVYTVDFDPGIGVTEVTVIEDEGGNDAYISVFDSNGEFQWMHQLGGASLQMANGIAFDAGGNLLVTGQFSNYLNCDPGVSDFTFASNGFSDWEVFIVKLSSSGAFEWARRIGGPDLDVGSGIAVDENDNVIVTGNFGLTVDIDPTDGILEFTAIGTWYDLFVLKLSAEGNFIWAKQMGSPTSDAAFSVAVDAGGNIYSTGIIDGDCDLDPGVGTEIPEWEGGKDVYISVLDSDGNYLWGENFGAHEDDWGNSIAVDDDHIYLTGIFKENLANFGDFHLNSSGNEDVFVFKLTHPPFNSVNDTERNLIGLFPNPSDDLVSISGVSSPCIITFFDNAGKMVFHGKCNGTLDVSWLDAGVYTVCIQYESTTSYERLVITR